MLKKFLALTICSVLVVPLVQANEVNLYSARKEALIKPVLDQFSAQSGIKVNLITGDADALISRIANEGKFSPADMLVTTDVGRLVRAKELGLLQAVQSEEIERQVPTHLRDADQQWIALTIRARPIMYAPERVDVKQLTTMEELTDARFKGRICVRSSSNIYNQSMVSAMIEQLGEENTLNWAKGLVANFARPPKGGDRDQIKAVAAGQCDIAIANTYYLAGMLNSADSQEVEAANKVKVLWPNQGDRGTHINISGAGITRHAPNKANAQALLDFMLSKEAQAWYAEHNGEYPLRSDVEQSDVLKSFGEFKAENIPLDKVGAQNATALKLMDKAGWK
ncbi:Fe(3+) ABC transporter substrate-binding protein [Aliiglaciecola sp. CAU 1673]|uniref:Fe(3+) ABC transporter substrate-binding protein n=1 Tax=Aliiglaciecola sp. CAU 1673 TaxID=3032595 RepID=UPI0023DBE2E9|nr:Fe(3+) ABC transporter substrate-binding protein [Aliiglaciecola sp. CAU 1673]MDF2177163.1 Fe(3+) ABC transporter substrate-binding protein [Aliiglaciecola sp. CAU 1673]